MNTITTISVIIAILGANALCYAMGYDSGARFVIKELDKFVEEKTKEILDGQRNDCED